MAKADSPKTKGTWSRSEGSLFYLELGCQLRFRSSLLEGKGTRRWGGWRDYPLSFSFRVDALTPLPLSSREKLYRAENKIWMAKMCMFNLITGVSCLPVALSSELPVSCSVPDRCIALPQMVLDAVQSVPQNPCLKDAEVFSQPFLGRPVHLSQTRPVCI